MPGLHHLLPTALILPSLVITWSSIQIHSFQSQSHGDSLFPLAAYWCSTEILFIPPFHSSTTKAFSSKDTGTAIAVGGADGPKQEVVVEPDTRHCGTSNSAQFLWDERLWSLDACPHYIPVHFLPDLSSSHCLVSSPIYNAAFGNSPG